MKEFIEKLIDRLEEIKTYYAEDFSQGYSCEVGCVERYEVEKIINELTEEYKPKTQADKIRSMSDAELAELFAQYSCEDADYTSLLPIKDCKWGTKQEVIDRNLKWLQSEA